MSAEKISMEDLEAAFGDDWSHFLVSLAENEVEIDDLADYTDGDLAEAIVEAFPDIKVHKKKKLVKAMRAYFGQQAAPSPQAPAPADSPAPGLSQEDRVRTVELMKEYQEVMTSMGNAMQALAMAGRQEEMEALQNKLMSVGQDIQCNQLLNGGVAELEKIIKDARDSIPAGLGGEDSKTQIEKHLASQESASEKFSKRLDELSKMLINGEVSNGHPHRRIHYLTEAFTAASGGPPEKMDALWANLEDIENPKLEPIANAPITKFEGVWKGPLDGRNYNSSIGLIIHQGKIASEEIEWVGVPSFSEGQLEFRYIWEIGRGTCFWTECTLQAVSDSELRADMVHHRNDDDDDDDDDDDENGGGKGELKNVSFYLQKEEDEDAAEKFKEANDSLEEKIPGSYSGSLSRTLFDVIKTATDVGPFTILYELGQKHNLIKDVNTRLEEDTGNTLLHIAAQNNNGIICRWLCERGAKPNLYGSEKLTPMDLAYESCTSRGYRNREQKGDDSALAVLMEHGGDLQKDKFEDAVENSYTDVVKLLAPKMTPKEINKMNALHMHMQARAHSDNDDLIILKSLLDAKADPNRIDEDNDIKHPIAEALYHKPFLVETLIEYGSNVSKGLEESDTYSMLDHPPALRRAINAAALPEALKPVLSDDVSAIKSLAKGPQRHAIWNVPDEFGFTLPEIACLHGCSNVASFLGDPEGDMSDAIASNVPQYAAWAGLKVEWADADGTAYENLKEAIDKCPPPDRHLLQWKVDASITTASLDTRRRARQQERNPTSGGGGGGGGSGGSSNLQDRMQDGIDTVKTKVSSFFASDYRPPSLMTFFDSLDEKAMPDSYKDKDMILWDTKRLVLSKVVDGCELRADHIAALYMYTLESDIYRICNRIMRLGDAEGIETWRPFIYHLCQALDAVDGSGSTELYRGIAIPFNLQAYDVGKRVSWASFTSASEDKEVAIQFMSQAPLGILFVLNTSRGCPISEFSFYPEEAEQLIRPSSQWQVSGIFEADEGYSVTAKALDAEQAEKLQKVVIILEEVEEED